MQERILIVDDIEAVRQDIRNYLCPPVSAEDMFAHLMSGQIVTADPGYVIHEAEQGDLGVAKARQAREKGEPYDVIIVDMMMPPGIDGAETIRRIREFDSEVRVVLCTAFNEFSPEKLAEVNGGIPPGFISKPIVNRNQLLDAIRVATPPADEYRVPANP